MNKRIKITSANFFFMLFSLIFILAQFYLAIAVAFGAGRNLLENTYVTVFITEILFILLPSLIFALVHKLDVRFAFRLNRLKLKPALLIILISFPAYMIATMLNSWVLYILQFFGNIPADSIPIPKTIPELLFGIIVIAVLPGVCEEVLNRGIMLRAYENRGSLKAVIITGLFFGLFHFDITNFFGPALLGALLGYYAIRTNSIFAAMLAHFLNNTIAEILSFLYRNEPATEYVQISGAEVLTVSLTGIVCIFVVIWLLRVLKRATENTAVIQPPISDVREDIRSVLTHYPVVIVICIYVLLAFLNLLMIRFFTV